MDLARRSLISVSWNFATNLAVHGLTFTRAIILARLLPVEVFGIFAGLHAVIEVTVTTTDFGLFSAFLHHAPETEDEDRAARVHFSLRLGLLAVWVLLAVFGGLVLLQGPQRLAWLLMVFANFTNELTGPARAVLARRVDHRRSALITLLTTLLNVSMAISTAWMGWGLFSIVVADVVTTCAAFMSFYFIRPAWRIRLSWQPEILHYYLDFGQRAYASTFLYHLLDRLDDLWTRFRLGETAMGFYSRAYRFASFPRSILATPVNLVIGGTYAELKGERQKLSQAFFRANALLIRSGFLLAGWMALIAPEFIRILLTDKWLPMLDAFRLMLLFTLLDPLKLSISDVLNAVGRPELVVRTRGIQLLVLLVGLALLSPSGGIAGVALAVNIMLVLGIAILLWYARRFVDYSLARLFAVPAGALAAGLVITGFVSGQFVVPVNDWLSGGIKTLVFCLVYLGLLLVFEKDRLVEMVGLARNLMRQSQPPETEA